MKAILCAHSPYRKKAKCNFTGGGIYHACEIPKTIVLFLKLVCASLCLFCCPISASSYIVIYYCLCNRVSYCSLFLFFELMKGLGF